MKIWSVKSEFNFLLNGMVKTRSHMVQMMVYIGKTDLKHCLVMKHHFHWDKFMKVGPVESHFNFLSKENIKTMSYMVKNMLYKGKTEVKQCFGTIHHFHWDKFMKIGPVESQKHFLLKETIKTRSHMVKHMLYIRKNDVKLCLVTKHPFH